MVINQQQQKPINFTNPFGNLSQDPAIQQGLLGNWAFSMANQGENGGRSYFFTTCNFASSLLFQHTYDIFFCKC